MLDNAANPHTLNAILEKSTQKISLRTLAAFVSTPERTLQHWCIKKRLPLAVKQGKAWFVPEHYIDLIRESVLPLAHN